MNEMNGAPKVSVIIPVYNVEKYLEKCLNSALSQTLESFEVVCVDDGSTDSSPEILARFASEHGNMRVVRQENAGQSAARNAALDIAAGEYILFLDSDDWFTSAGAAAQLCECARQDHLDILFYSAEMFYEDARDRSTFGEGANHYRRRGSYPNPLSGPELFTMFIRNGDFRGSACVAMYRRAFLNAHHLRFLTGILHEDDVFVTQTMCLAARAAYVDLPLYGRLVRANSTMTGDHYLRRVRGYCLGAQFLEEFYAQRLRDAASPFRKCYFRRLREVAERAGALWLAASPAERREYLGALPNEEARAVRRWLRTGVPLARVRPLRRRLHRLRKRALRRGRAAK